MSGGYPEHSYLRTGDGSKWRELLAQFLVIDGVIKVLDVQVNTLEEEVQQARKAVLNSFKTHSYVILFTYIVPANLTFNPNRAVN